MMAVDVPGASANPWLDLKPWPPYVLPADDQILQRHPRARARLHLECPPIPWMGRPDKARVLLLTLNPRYAADTPAEFAAPGLLDDVLSALRLDGEEPPHSLNQRYRGTPGFKYWVTRLRELINEVGLDRVAREVAFLEYFPYFSETFEPVREPLASSRFTLDLLTRALQDSTRVVVVLRGGRRWFEAVPELKGRSFLARNPRSSTVSRGNVGDEGFARVCIALGAHVRPA